MALKKQVLIVSQVIPQWYVDVLAEALEEGVHIDIITGSNVRGNVIKSPKHEADSLKSRLVCWYTFPFCKPVDERKSKRAL